MDKDFKRIRVNPPTEDLDAPLADDSLLGLLKSFVIYSRFKSLRASMARTPSGPLHASSKTASVPDSHGQVHSQPRTGR